jgi:hypothetical protein
MQRRRTTDDPPFLPLSRATVQTWGLNQTGQRSTGERAARRPLRTILQWIATTLRH